MTEIPESAKVVLLTPSFQEVLTFTTDDGIPNILGGLIEPKESPRQALRREAEEELPASVITYDISDEPIGYIEGRVHEDRERRWHVFAGRFHLPWFSPLLNPEFQLVMPEVDNATMQVETVTDMLARDPARKFMATRAVELAFQYFERETRGVSEPQLLGRYDGQRLVA